MNRILVDLEKGGVALLHDLSDLPTDGEQLPAEITGTVEHFATSLGLDTSLLGGPEKGFLFDLVNMAVEAVGAGGSAQAGGEAAPGAGAPAAGEPGAVQEPSGEQAPPSNEREAAPAAESAAVAPLNPGGAPPHGPADVDLPPVTAPADGYEICPKCSGFRTVLEAGTVTPCPECRGAGEVPVKAAPVA